MAITFEETVQVVINLVKENELLKERIKQLEQSHQAAMVQRRDVREPDNQPKLKEVK